MKAGAPVMWNFLEVARELERGGLVADSEAEFRLVFKGQSALQSVHSKFRLDHRNLESVFAAFEMSRITGKLGSMEPDEVQGLPDAMRRLIVRTLEETMLFTVGPTRTLEPPYPYGAFVELIKDIHPGEPWARSSVITTNYDLCMETALHDGEVPIDYCLQDNQPGRGLKLIKLHGSLNWGYCQVCKTISPVHPGEFLAEQANRPFPGGKIQLRVGSSLESGKHACGGPLQKEPFIVPPTWNKTMHQSELRAVWSAAARELKDAEEIVVIGYSLPDADFFFRYLLAIGAVGEALIRKFWVIDPDPSENVRSRFREILGTAAEDRFALYRMEFIEALGPGRHLRKELKRSPEIR